MKIFKILSASLVLWLSFVGCQDELDVSVAKDTKVARTLIEVSDVNSSSKCSLGGKLITIGLDNNFNELIEEDEIKSKDYICNVKDGLDGKDGVDGQKGNDGSDGEDGQNGVKGETGSDGEDGATGQTGSDGKDGRKGSIGKSGLNGINALVRLDKLLAGGECRFGGTKINSGLDTNKNKVLDDAEITQTLSVCISSKNIVEGRFGKNAVEGLEYVCSSKDFKGVTDEEGDYVCLNGDDVNFSLGNISLGATHSSDETINAYSLYPNSTKLTLNVEQLLLSLDDDQDDKNGISIDSNLVNSLKELNLEINASDFDTQVASVLNDFPSNTDALNVLDNELKDLGKKVIGDLVFYKSGKYGKEPFIYTPYGLSLVKDINTEPKSEYVTSMTYMDSYMYYSLQNGNGSILYRSDTKTGVVTKIASSSYRIKNLTSHNKLLYMIINDGMYTNNGYSSKLVKFKSQATKIRNFTIIDNLFYLNGYDKARGYEPWISDGISKTNLIADLNSTDSSSPSNFVKFKDKIYFFANYHTVFKHDFNRQLEVWNIDKSLKATKLKFAFEGQPKQIVASDTHLLIRTIIATYSYDGKTVKTLTHYDFGNFYPQVAVKNNVFYFDAYGANTKYLYKSDGSENNLSVVLELDNMYGSKLKLSVLNHDLHVFQDDLHNGVGFNYWRVNTNTFNVEESYNVADKRFYDTKIGGNKLYYSTQKGIYTLDGGENVLVNKYNANSFGSIYYVPKFIKIKDKTYFSVMNNNIEELWISDGSSEGTKLIKKLSNNVVDFSYIDETILFSYSFGEENIYKVDAKSADVKLIKNDFEQYKFASKLVNFKNRVYFSAKNSNNKLGVYSTDAKKVEKIYTSNLSNIKNLISSDDYLYFISEGSGNINIFRSSGEKDDARSLKHSFQYIRSMVVLNNELYALAKVYESEYKLYKLNKSTLTFSKIPFYHDLPNGIDNVYVHNSKMYLVTNLGALYKLNFENTLATKEKVVYVDESKYKSFIINFLDYSDTKLYFYANISENGKHSKDVTVCIDDNNITIIE